LPLHAAQVSSIRNFHNPAYGFEPQFQINYFTPYSLAIYLSVLFARFVSVLSAIKIVVTLTLLLIPVAMCALLKEFEGDIWWSLLGFPFGFGMSFVWGFFSYIAAIPIGLLFIAQAVRYAKQPDVRRGLTLFTLCILLFFSHGIALAVCGPAAFMILCHRWRLKGFIRTWPLLAPLPFVVSWFYIVGGSEPRFHEVTDWGALGFHRLGELLTTLISFSFDPVAEKFTIAMIIALLIGVSGVKRSGINWLLLLYAGLIYCFSPFAVFGIYFTYQRLGIFVAVFSLLSIVPTRSSIRRTISHSALFFLALAWMLVLNGRFESFNREAVKFDQVVEKMSPNKKVLGLIFDRSIEGTEMPFLHFDGWYQALKGGALGFSFALYYNSIVRYRPGAAPLDYSTSHAILWDPESWSVMREGNFDYLLVRSVSDKSEWIRQKSNGQFEPTQQKEEWALFQRRTVFK
jgi:hypothetical protein